jgi:hypothetical protein
MLKRKTKGAKKQYCGSALVQIRIHHFTSMRLRIRIQSTENIKNQYYSTSLPNTVELVLLSPKLAALIEGATRLPSTRLRRLIRGPLRQVVRIITAAPPCRQQGGGPRRHPGRRRRRLALIIAPPSLAAAAAQVAIVGKFAAAAITRSRSISASENFFVIYS